MFGKPSARRGPARESSSGRGPSDLLEGAAILCSDTGIKKERQGEEVTLSSTSAGAHDWRGSDWAGIRVRGPAVAPSLATCPHALGRPPSTRRPERSTRLGATGEVSPGLALCRRGTRARWFQLDPFGLFVADEDWLGGDRGGVYHTCRARTWEARRNSSDD